MLNLSRYVLLVVIGLMASGCKMAGRSEVKVIDGIEAGSDILTSVVMYQKNPGGFCTGAFLNGSVLLTAAHCVYNTSSISVSGIEHLSVVLAASNFADFYAAANAANWLGTAAQAFSRYDLALVSFPPGTAASSGVTSFFSLDRSTDPTGRPVFVTGFGEKTPLMADHGIKRWGRNAITSVVDGVIAVDGGTSATAGEDSHSSRGDSGGPLLDQGTATPGDETIVGVVSLVPQTSGPARAHYPWVQSQYARALFKYAIEQRGFEAFAY